MKRLVLIILGLLCAVGTGLAIWIGPRNVLGMLRYDRRREGTLQVGDALPDVTLIDPVAMTPVRLRERRGSRPLVLVFGSYT